MKNRPMTLEDFSQIEKVLDIALTVGQEGKVVYETYEDFCPESCTTYEAERPRYVWIPDSGPFAGQTLYEIVINDVEECSGHSFCSVYRLGKLVAKLDDLRMPSLYIQTIRKLLKA